LGFSVEVVVDVFDQSNKWSFRKEHWRLRC